MQIKQKHPSILTHQRGFTIVELLVVIVVIAILAAVTIVAFNGISRRATVSQVSAELSQAARLLENDKTLTGAYPSSLALANEGKGITASNGTTHQYTVEGAGVESTYCITATKGKVSLFMSSTNKKTGQGFCSQHSDPDAVPTVMYAGLERYETPSNTEVSFNIPFNLEATDTVFVVMATGYNTVLQNFSVNSTAVTRSYAKSMGSSGYQDIHAYLFSGQTGSQSFKFRPGWSPQPTNPGAPSQKGHLAIYVIRNLRNPTRVQFTDTAFGWKTASELVAPAAMTTTGNQFAVFAYVYYGNRLPTWTDNSNPGPSWTVHNARTRGVGYPELDVRHAIVPGSTVVHPGTTMTEVSGGAITAGAVTFLIGG